MSHFFNVAMDSSVVVVIAVGILMLVLLESHWTSPLNGLECGIPKTITGIYGVADIHSKRHAHLFNEEAQHLIFKWAQ
jgi:hypothetical protein